MGICNLCKGNKNIMWSDWVPGASRPKSKGFPIKLCYECLIFIGWDFEITPLLPRIRTCPECQQKYVFRKESTAIRCGLCWNKFINNRTQNATH